MHSPPQRIVIVGGGHAHVHVLRAWAARAEPSASLTLVSPEPATTYTGMVPGVIAGQYRLADAQIDLAALCARAGARFVADRVCDVDADRGRLSLERSDAIDYDVVSFDIGARPTPGDIAADAPVVWVKPIEQAVARLAELVTSRSVRAAVIVGAGAGGVELAFALRARLGAAARVTLCDRQPAPLAERGRRLSRLVTAALQAGTIAFVGGVEATRVDRAGVQLAGGAPLAADLVVWSTGAAAPPLFATAGLPVDARGFLRVDATLRCVGRPRILAAGDAIALAGHDLPKAGVFAVRQGPVIDANLRLVARGAARLQAYHPQPLFLSLLNTCDGRAILSYGRAAVHTRWAWTLKDRIDRGFVARFRAHAPPPSAT